MDSYELESEETSVNDDDVEIYDWITNNYDLFGFCIVYLVIFVFGLIANLLVIFSILRHKSRQTVVNVFMFNIAVANILLCLFVVPIDPVDMIVDGWPFGSIVCHLWPCMNYSVRFASMLILASIAVDRYLDIVHPLKKTMTTRKWIIIVAIIWLVSIATSLPLGIFFNYKEHSDQYAVCFASWPSMTSSKIYFITTFVLFFLIPLVVMAHFYVASSIKMSTNDKSTPMAEKRRTNRLLMIMTIILCICTMPYHIFLLMSIFSPSINFWKHFAMMVRVGKVLALCFPCLIPLFYTWLNKINIKQFCLVGRCYRRRPHQSSCVDGVDTNVQTHKHQSIENGVINSK